MAVRRSRSTSSLFCRARSDSHQLAASSFPSVRSTKTLAPRYPGRSSSSSRPCVFNALMAVSIFVGSPVV